jgi:3-isopropylmalate/(R)-2-methylmalate dehydratase small subunit
MQPMRIHRGQVAPIERANIDTDQIIPKQFLKRIERTGYGPYLFYDWRYDFAHTRLQAGAIFNPDNEKSDFILNREPYRHASILLAGKNFGCGSSREHAAWALNDFGFRVVIAPSFADIFHSNAANNGLLTVELPESEMAKLFARASATAVYELTVDVERLLVADDQGWSSAFPLDPFRRHCLLNGLDQIGITLQHEQAIREFEQRPAVY